MNVVFYFLIAVSSNMMVHLYEPISKSHPPVSFIEVNQYASTDEPEKENERL